MSDLNVGIVGLGWVAGAHIDTFGAVNGANVTAICSRREHNPSDLEEQYGIPLKPIQITINSLPIQISTSLTYVHHIRSILTKQLQLQRQENI